MTDQDVIDLYRCLLGRAPENANTIAAFRHYYPDFDAGRRAVLKSDEFKIYAAQVTGEAKRPAASGPLALALLQAAAVPGAPGGSSDTELRQGFGVQRGQLGEVRLAVVVGDADFMLLEDIASLGSADCAVLQIASVPRAPGAQALTDGTMLMQSPWAPAETCAFLAAQKADIDALFILGPPAGPGWLRSLLPLLRGRALVAIHQADGFDHAGVGALVAAMRPGEPPIAWRGFHLHHLGGWHLPVTYGPPDEPRPSSVSQVPSLAIAAIVRDEAACVVNMLTSALPFASFFAILDTGSADATPALVQAFLASVPVPGAFACVDHERFEDRFSDMRNAAVAMVPAQFDWVLMLDADEELAAEDVAAMRALIAEARHPAYALPRYNYRGADKSGSVSPYPDRQVRLLRHGAGPRPLYSGAVHETVRDMELGNPPLDASALGGPRGGPHIHHLVRRFKNTEAEDRKQAFYRQVAARHREDGAK